MARALQSRSYMPIEPECPCCGTAMRWQGVTITRRAPQSIKWACPLCGFRKREQVVVEYDRPPMHIGAQL